MAQGRDGLAILEKAASRMPPGSPVLKRLRDVLDGELATGIHLGVFVEPFLEAIFDGRKTIESRFSIHRCAPFDCVLAGDVILLKRSGGPVVGVAFAGKARYYELNAKKLGDIREQFATKIYADDDGFWEARAEKRFATLIEIDGVSKIDTLEIDKRDRRGWVTYKTASQSCLALAG